MCLCLQLKDAQDQAAAEEKAMSKKLGLSEKMNTKEFALVAAIKMVDYANDKKLAFDEKFESDCAGNSFCNN